MSGRGRSGKSGRGKGRTGGKTNGRGTNTAKNTRGGAGSASTSEMKFVPQYSGNKATTTVTYDTVKDYIILEVQQKFDHGVDMATSLRKMEYTTFNEDPDKPVRMITAATDEKLASIEQAEYDMMYQEDFKLFIKRKEAYRQNKAKAYALIIKHCNKTMVNKIEEVPDFESRIRNDPVELLKEIRSKMYDPARAKYEFVSLTETLLRFLLLKQEDGESLMDYTKRFKQAKDILIGAVGKDFLKDFGMKTQEYNKAKPEEQEEVLKSTCDRFTTYVFF